MASTSLKVSFYDIPIQVWSTRPLLRLASEILNKESSMQGPGRWLDLSENVMPTTAPAITLLVRSHIEDNSFFSIALLSLYTSPWVLRWNFISSSPATSLILCLCKQHVQRASPPAAVSTKQTFYSGWKVDILWENLRQGLLPIDTSAFYMCEVVVPIHFFPNKTSPFVATANSQQTEWDEQSMTLFPLEFI